MARIAGVDGCKAGWIAVCGHSPDKISVAIFKTIADLFGTWPDLAQVAIDMPIGLPETISGHGRAAEQAVRSLLGRRQSSVFPIPSRRAVYAVTPQPMGMANILSGLAAANAVARETSLPPRGMPIQTFGILPKIRELDQYLRQNQAMQAIVSEIHPEILFWRMNKRTALTHPKKTPAGQNERRALLLAQGLRKEDLLRSPPRGAAMDDMLDAMAAYCAARHLAEGRGQPHPNPFTCDAEGLPIAIWTWRWPS